MTDEKIQMLKTLERDIEYYSELKEDLNRVTSFVSMHGHNRLEEFFDEEDNALIEQYRHFTVTILLRHSMACSKLIKKNKNKILQL